MSMLAYENRDPHNGDYNLKVEFKRHTGSTRLPTEVWRILIMNVSEDIELHAWSSAFIGAFLDATATDDAYLVASPARRPMS